MPVSVNQLLANTLGLADPLGRVADDGRIGFNGRVNINGRPIRFAPNFDGVDDRGVLASRAVNPDGDNTFEFWTPANFSSFQGVICQSTSATTTLREFTLVTGSSGLLVRLGGSETVIMSQAQGLKPSTRYGLTLIGTTAQVFEGGLGGTLVRATTFARGAAREPAANTVIGCIPAGTGFGNFFQGLQYNIRINGVLWAMNQRNQTIQPSTPAGNNMTLVNVTSDRWQEVPQ